ncbi:hypothetical protein PEDI_10460 [Persicobacter diffluens]|uniref:Uncharacterized protein n=1 Tax=Persicobacter diffluens TaxID=981 RepID=A0AAN4VUS0_9BACT|nr:hypothetical protein PEDI_10460 [Persicobacter diffluens]
MYPLLAEGWVLCFVIFGEFLLKSEKKGNASEAFPFFYFWDWLINSNYYR